MKTTKDLTIKKTTKGFFKKKTTGINITATVAEAVGGAVIIGGTVAYTGYRAVRGIITGVNYTVKKIKQRKEDLAQDCAR